MSLIDKVMNSDFFRSYADKLQGEDLEKLEESVRKMLSGADSIHAIIKGSCADQKGRDDLSDSLEYLFTHEGQKEWDRDKN